VPTSPSRQAVRSRRAAHRWSIVAYPDPQAAIDFLVATFGFEPAALIRDGSGEDYAEIELCCPHGSGGIIIGRSLDPEPHWLYVVDPEPALYARARAAGLTVLRGH
jgi:hypothetical protein